MEGRWTHNVDQVEELAEDVASGVAVVQVHRVVEVLSETLHFGAPLRLALDYGTANPVRDHAHFALFPLLPYPVGRVEEDALEEQEEGHPLVVRVEPLLPDVIGNTRVGHVGAHCLRVAVWHGECVRYPAEGVYHVGGDRSFRNAVYRVTCELSNCFTSANSCTFCR